MCPQYGELRPTSGWDRLTSLGVPLQISTGFASWQRYCTTSSSGRQPNFAALNRGRHLYSAGRPSRWALAHILVFVFNFAKNQRILMQFSLLDLTMNNARDGKIFPFPWGDVNPHLIHGPLGPAKSLTQTASRSVQPFLQGSLVWQTDRQTDHATRSLTTDRIYVCSTTMRSKN